MNREAVPRRGVVLIAVALVGVGLVGFLVYRSLSQLSWDPTVYAAFGEDATRTTSYAEDKLGGDVYLRSGQGHDGKHFFVQANDPWILDPISNARVLDRPLYRSQRMLYPTLAGGFGLFSPGIIVWALIAVNILGFGLGTFATADVARSMSMSPWWGLTFTINIGLISELNIDGAGVIAAAFAMSAVALLLRGKESGAIALLVLAVLAREAMLITAVGSAWWMWRFRRKPRTAWRIIVIPGLAVVAWAIYLRIRIGGDAGGADIQELGVPLVGFVRALIGWVDQPSLDLAVGVVIMATFILFGRRVFRSDALVGWAFIGFVGLGLVFTEQVWRSYFDISRAIAPVLTAYLLLLFQDTPLSPKLSLPTVENTS